MLFLTEEDIRARCPNPGCTLHLSPKERLTPSASEFATQMRVSIIQDGQAVPPAAPATPAAAPPAPVVACHPCTAGAEAANMTHLDAATMVPKSHPRIALRGKLDTLLAVTVLVQTQFDPKNRLTGFLKTCLADVHGWIMRVLTAEVSGAAVSVSGMGGMDPETLRAVSRDPARYLGVDHYCPDAALGGNAALLNWLRAVTREGELAAAQCDSCQADIAASLNRLSSAVYVLLLLTLAAEKGVDVTKLKA